MIKRENQYRIYEYSEENKPKLLEIIKSNTPNYFDPEETEEFNSYLDNEKEEYYVLYDDNRIIGCGGINYFYDQKHARLSWDMIHPDYHSKGCGKHLTQYRIDKLSKDENLDYIVVRTSQLVFPFYQKMGFRIEEIKKDFWAKGYDLYYMVFNFQSSNPD